MSCVHCYFRHNLYIIHISSAHRCSTSYSDLENHFSNSKKFSSREEDGSWELIANSWLKKQVLPSRTALYIARPCIILRLIGNPGALSHKASLIGADTSNQQVHVQQETIFLSSLLKNSFNEHQYSALVESSVDVALETMGENQETSIGKNIRAVSTVPELRSTGGKTIPLGTLALPPQNCTRQLSLAMFVYCTESQLLHCI